MYKVKIFIKYHVTQKVMLATYNFRVRYLNLNYLLVVVDLVYINYTYFILIYLIV